MTNDVCATTRASRCKGLNGTFETIECVADAIHGYLERFVVIVTAGFAFRHGVPLNQVNVWADPRQLLQVPFFAVVTQASSAYLRVATPKITRVTANPYNRNGDCVAQPQPDLAEDFSADRGEAFLGCRLPPQSLAAPATEVPLLPDRSQLRQENDAPIREFERIMVCPLLVLIYLSEDCRSIS